eukprot:4955418-Pleurochrysis_carterae.AAC.1
MRVFEYASRGFTANARQPNGRIGMMRGFTPVRHSTSTEWATAYVQKEVGAPLATKLERASSMILRIARSATPFSWWTCGGHVVA